MKSCFKCGQQMYDNFNYCGNCGTKLNIQGRTYTSNNSCSSDPFYSYDYYGHGDLRKDSEIERKKN